MSSRDNLQGHSRSSRSEAPTRHIDQVAEAVNTQQQLSELSDSVVESMRADIGARYPDLNTNSFVAMVKKYPRADQLQTILDEYSRFTKSDIATKYGYDYGNWFGEAERGQFAEAIQMILSQYPSVTSAPQPSAAPASARSSRSRTRSEPTQTVAPAAAPTAPDITPEMRLSDLIESGIKLPLVLAVSPANAEAAYDEVNIASYQKTFGSMNRRAIVRLSQTMDRIGAVNGTSGIRDYLTSLGYEYRGLRFDEEELEQINAMLYDQAMSTNDPLYMMKKDIADIDGNGIIRRDTMTGAGSEATIFSRLADLKGLAFKNFLTSAGTSIEEYAVDPKTSKAKVLAVLGTETSAGIPIDTSLRNKSGEYYNRRGKQTREKIATLSPEQQSDMNRAIEEAIQEGTLRNVVAGILNENDKQTFLKDIRLSMASIVGSVVGGGAGIDIYHFTKETVLSARIGVIGGVPGIALALRSQLTERIGVSLMGGAALGFIPIGSGTVSIQTTVRTPELFNQQADLHPDVYFVAGAFVAGSAVGPVGGISWGPERAIERNVSAVEKTLERIGNSIKTGQAIDLSDISMSDEDRTHVQTVLLPSIRAAYERCGGYPWLLPTLLQGYQNYYRERLIAKHAGLHIGTGLGFGAAFGENVTSVLIGIGVTYISQNYRQDKDRTDEHIQTDLSRQDIEIADAGVVQYKGFRVLRIPKNVTSYLSITRPGVQIESDDTYYYISGVSSMSDIHMRQVASAEHLTTILTIGEVGYHPDGSIRLPTEFSQKNFKRLITTSLPETFHAAGDSVAVEDSELAARTESIRRVIDANIRRSVLNSSSVLQNLQRQIGKATTGGTDADYDHAWQLFVSYVRQRHSRLASLHGQLPSDRASQRLILHTMLSAFMSDIPKHEKDLASWENRETGTGTSRDEAFRKRAVEAAGIRGRHAQELSRTIQSTQDTYLEAFEGVPASRLQTDFYTEGDMIAFPVSSQIDGAGHSTFRGLHAVTGVIEVAHRPHGEQMMKVDNEALTNGLIKGIPTYVLDGLLSVCQSAGMSDVTTRDQVRTILLHRDPRITFDTVYFKWGRCFNDCYALRDFRVQGQSLHIAASTIDIRYQSDDATVTGMVGGSFVASRNTPAGGGSSSPTSHPTADPTKPASWNGTGSGTGSGGTGGGFPG